MSITIIPTSVFADVVNGEVAQLQVATRIADLGAQGIEIRRELFVESDDSLPLEQCRQAIQQANLLYTVYSVPASLWQKNHGLNQEIVYRSFTEAQRLGADAVKLSLGHYDNVQSSIDVLLTSLDQFFAEQSSVSPIHLWIENDQTTYGGDPAHILSFFEQLATLQAHSQWYSIGMTFDIGNWLYAGQDALEAAQHLSPYVTYIHAKHSVRQENRYLTLPLPIEEKALWRQVIKLLPNQAWRAIEFTLSDDTEIKYYNHVLSTAGRGNIAMDHPTDTARVNGNKLLPLSNLPVESNNTLLDIVTFGEAMTMFVAEEVGDLHNVALFSKRLAGAEANAAIGFARLGLRSGWASKVGADAFGTFVQHKLASEHVNLDHVQIDSERPTGFQLKSKVISGDPQVQYFRRGSAASQMSIADLDATYFSSARHLHMTGIPLALSDHNRVFAQHVIQQMRAHHRSISFDPNLRPALWSSHTEMIETINHFAIQADIVLPGIEEGQILTGSSVPEEIAEFYLQQGVKVVVVKLGPAGAYYRTQEQSGTVSGFIVEQVIDTVGAGDGFAVGTVSGWLAGLTIEEAITRGCAIGALAVQSIGDHEGYPSENELQYMIEHHPRYPATDIVVEDVTRYDPSLEGVK
ncbi:PfkB family carbohydrate kinase [Paenibacillus kyungheensis]|uniref:PfkB family carbohydrate kinase n=1 Tax=Paenibacillus kyungheensis TaxID=1452732 RepID=UPI0030810E90